MAHNINFYGQDGVDRWLFENGYLNEKGTFVDVGSSDPILNSNTKSLEELGWIGICIDGDARVQSLYEKYRPKTPFELAIVTDKEKVVDYYLNPLQEASGMSDHIGGANMVKAQATTLNHILEKHDIENVDLLSIDVEGHELEVLKGFVLKKFQPRIIVVEHSTFGKTNDQAKDYLLKRGYNLAHTTEFNHILIRK